MRDDWAPRVPTRVAGIGAKVGEKRGLSHTTEDPATAPNPTHSAGEAVAPVCGHGGLDHFQRLEGTERSVGVFRGERTSFEDRTCPKVVTSNMFKPAPSSRLLNLTGFFSRVGAAALSEIDDISGG